MHREIRLQSVTVGAFPADNLGTVAGMGYSDYSVNALLGTRRMLTLRFGTRFRMDLSRRSRESARAAGRPV